MKWEYLCIESPLCNKQGLADFLNEKGQDGWELASSHPLSTLSALSSNTLYTLVLKRPLTVAEPVGVYFQGGQFHVGGPTTMQQLTDEVKRAATETYSDVSEVAQQCVKWLNNKFKKQDQ